MSNEIKEILEFLSNENYYIQDIDFKFKRLYSDEVKTLLDYITNLQEENEIVHKDFDELSERYFFTKSRIDKAIEYIKEHQRKDEFLNLNEWQTRELLNILKGSDKE